MSVANLTSGQSFATLSAAIAASVANDVLRLPAGAYDENFPDIVHNLTIQSSGGLAYLTNSRLDTTNANHRAILNMPLNAGANLTVSGLDISGARNDVTHPATIGGANAAAILMEAGNGTLTVTNCHIHDNEDGILTGGPGTASVHGTAVVITGSEIDHNGLPPDNIRFGFDHNLYIGDVARFTIVDSYVHDALGGNEIKSRALASIVENNRIFDNGSDASYQIDLPYGGNNLIENNIIEKGPNSPQGFVVEIGAESPPTRAGSTLILSGNTIVNDSTLLGNGATVLYNATKDPATGLMDPATISGNLFFGVAHVFQDRYGTPDNLDIATGNQMSPLSSAPALNTASPVCFAAGTRIATDRGETPVEALRAGDLVLILDAGRLAPRRVVWIGERRFDLTRHPRPSRAAPVRIRASAFAPGSPRRDLLLSPDHCLFVDGALLSARLLINGTTVVQELGTATVHYYHIELDRHAVLLAEGLPAESWLDVGNRAGFGNAGRAAAIPRQKPVLCAPLMAGPEAMRPVWRRLADRAAAMGFARPSGGADAHLVVDGRRIAPLPFQAGRLRFPVPAGAAAVRLMSHTVRPAAQNGGEGDIRALGVRVRKIAIWGRARHAVLQAGDPALADGWHAVESLNGAPCRWTDGDAALPVCCPEPCVVEVTCAE